MQTAISFFSPFVISLLQALIAAVGAYAVGALRAWWINLLGTRIEKAVGRAAGEILAHINGDVNLQAASEKMILSAVDKVFARVGGAIASLNVKEESIRGMIVGELGKLGGGVRPK